MQEDATGGENSAQHVPPWHLGNGEGLVEIAECLQLPVLTLDSDVKLRDAARQSRHRRRAGAGSIRQTQKCGYGLRRWPGNMHLLDTLESKLVLLNEDTAHGIVSVWRQSGRKWSNE
jgi:hypothetical protein